MERNPRNEQSRIKRRAGVALFGAFATAASVFAITNTGEAQIPCDPVIDNGCVPDNEGSMPTLPEKEPTTTTTEQPPETTTTTTEQPPVTTIVEVPVPVQPPVVDQPSRTE